LWIEVREAGLPIGVKHCGLESAKPDFQSVLTIGGNRCQGGNQNELTAILTQKMELILSNFGSAADYARHHPTP
jgi:hypothetical protein